MSARWDAQRRNSRAFKISPNKNAKPGQWLGVGSTWTNRDGSQVIASQIPQTTEIEKVTSATKDANINNNNNIKYDISSLSLEERKDQLHPNQLRLQNERFITGEGLGVAENIQPKWNTNITNDTGIDFLSGSQANSGVSTQQRLNAAGNAAASKALELMIAKITAPDPGEEGANRTEGAISGKNPWEEFYVPSLYTV